MADPSFYETVKVPDTVLLNFIKCKQNNTPVTPNYDYTSAYRKDCKKFYCIDCGPDSSMTFKDKKGNVIPEHELGPGMLKASFEILADARSYASKNSKEGRGYAIVEKVEITVIQERSLFRKEKRMEKVSPLDLFASGESINADELLKWRKDRAAGHEK